MNSKSSINQFTIDTSILQLLLSISICLQASMEVSNIWKDRQHGKFTLSASQRHFNGDGSYTDHHVVHTNNPCMVLTSQSGCNLLVVQLIPLSEDTDALFAKRHATRKDNIEFQGIFTRTKTHFGFNITNVTAFPLSFSFRTTEGDSEHQITQVNYIQAFSHIFLDGDCARSTKLHFQVTDVSVNSAESGHVYKSEGVYMKLDVCAVHPQNGWFPYYRASFCPQYGEWECSKYLIVKGRHEKLQRSDPWYYYSGKVKYSNPTLFGFKPRESITNAGLFGHVRPSPVDFNVARSHGQQGSFVPFIGRGSGFNGGGGFGISERETGFPMADSGYDEPDHGIEHGADSLINSSRIGTLTNYGSHSETVHEINEEYQMPHLRANTLVFGLSASENIVKLTDGYEDTNTILDHGSIPSVDSVKLGNEKNCCVCMEEVALCLSLPCAHKCICKTCLDEMSKDSSIKCPLCRKTISYVLIQFETK